MKVIPDISADGQELAKRLVEVQPGEMILYGELSDLITRNVRKEARSALSSARKYALRDDQAVFECVRGIGLKRLSDSEIARIGDAHLRRIHNTSRRGITKLSAVRNFATLAQAEQTRHNTAMSLLGVFYEISKARSIKRIEVVVMVAQKKLPLEDTLRAFGVHPEEQPAIT